MARALIVGCGCRGSELGRALLEDGWAVRGTSRRQEELARIEAAGIEAALADPDRPDTVLELVNDVAVLVLLFGGLEGTEEELAAIHGPRLERLMEHLVETPVRGILYEGSEAGDEVVLAAARTWRIPVELVGGETDLAGAAKAILAGRKPK